MSTGGAIRFVNPAWSTVLGMGALCRRIAERHDGRLGVASEPGVGSVFSVWRPR